MLNGLRDGDCVTETLNRLLDGGQDRHNRSVSFTELVARHNECSVFDVVMLHSLWPFTAAVANRPVGIANVENMAGTRVGRTAVMRAARTDAWLCPHCIDEDLDFWRLAYWRRSHQIPGALWCEKHRTRLGRMPMHVLEDGLPSHCVDRAAFESYSLVSELQQVPEIERFLNICHELLETGLPLERASCARALARRALGKGHCGHVNELADTVSAIVRRRVPRVWLREISPRTDWSRPAVLMIDAVFRGLYEAVPTLWIALIAAVLFDSGDEALAMLCDSGERQQVSDEMSQAKSR
jgi:hypothetical protein